ncbi:Uncharacterised protein [Streptococcus pneumoniae]|nr:Uncharacterised protein [Streptococcus pneumoniae]
MLLLEELLSLSYFQIDLSFLLLLFVLRFLMYLVFLQNQPLLHLLLVQILSDLVCLHPFRLLLFAVSPSLLVNYLLIRTLAQ